jgi:hypothetical protein
MQDASLLYSIPHKSFNFLSVSIAFASALSTACNVVALRYMLSVNGFYPPQSPLGKEGSPVLPLGKGELEGVSQGTLNTYARSAATFRFTNSSGTLYSCP